MSLISMFQLLICLLAGISCRLGKVASAKSFFANYARKKSSSLQSNVIVVLHNLYPENVPSVGALLEKYGVGIASVSLRHDGALESVKELTRFARDGATNILVGASSILSDEQVLSARASGAQFISSTESWPELVSTSRHLDLPLLSGFADSDSVVNAVREFRLTEVKLFPAQSPEHVKGVCDELRESLPDDFSSLEIIVAGGITPRDFQAYLNAGATGFACGVDCSPEKRASLIKRLDELAESPVLPRLSPFSPPRRASSDDPSNINVTDVHGNENASHHSGS